MAKIIYVEHDGTEHNVDVATGVSVMEGAVKNGVPGIDADCGGVCACGTCHVRIASQWASLTGSRSEQEEDMLSETDNVTAESRLSCQIEVSDALDGLVVHLPEYQYR